MATKKIIDNDIKKALSNYKSGKTNMFLTKLELDAMYYHKNKKSR